MQSIIRKVENKKRDILGLQINQISFKDSIEEVLKLANSRQPSYVCFANVHMTIEAYKNQDFAYQVNSATMVLPDGGPLAQSFKLLYSQEQERIAGMDFMPRLLEEINKGNLKIFLYGSTNDLLEILIKKINDQYPDVKIAGAIAPPFRPLSQLEQNEYIKQINDAGTHILFVALGCPKQEKWMYTHHTQINAVCLGVGGAFSTVAGIQKRAPKWMQQLSLEWTYRLIQEPKRLFKRYFITNSMFVALLVTRLVKRKVHGIK